jgi:hypothetical protein
MTRPGARLRSVATRFFDPSTMERLIDPAIADLQHEHDDAIHRGLVWRGRWVHIAGCVAVSKVIAAAATTASTRAIGDWACADGCHCGAPFKVREGVDHVRVEQSARMPALSFACRRSVAGV